MKRTILRFALIPLCVVEIGIVTGFLPQRWQEGIWNIFPHSPDRADVTHPALNWEVQQAMGGFAWVVYAILAVLLLANTFLIVRTWKTVRIRPDTNPHP